MMRKQQLVDELHRSARKRFPRRRSVIKAKNETLQADLVEMIPYARENKGIRYILTVIDTFSKMAWAIPVKRKTGLEVTEAMEKVIKSMDKPPKNIQSDFGKEFFNSHFKKLMDSYNINHYSTYTAMKAAIVERFNRTLKNKMWKKFSFNGSYKWLDILPKLVDEYNNTWHRTIKMKPIQVNAKNERKLQKTVYSNEIHMRRKPKFQVGDQVRISKYKNIFDKGYTPNWTTEIFKIKKVKYTDPYTYYLEDSEEKPIVGAFYSHELLKTANPDIFLVEKTIRKKGKKILVKWLGLDKSHNSWINKKDMF